jgi:hypothetical protein
VYAETHNNEVSIDSLRSQITYEDRKYKPHFPKNGSKANNNRGVKSVPIKCYLLKRALVHPIPALAPQTENALGRALLHAAEDLLVIVIAHRLSTVRRADRIIFSDDGEVKDIGDHDALMADPSGPYRRFVQLQSG